MQDQYRNTIRLIIILISFSALIIFLDILQALANQPSITNSYISINLQILVNLPAFI